MTTIKLIWETYTIRREIAKLGFIFSYTENAYIGNVVNLTENLTTKLQSLGVDFEPIDYIEINETYIVQQKNLRAQKRAEKYSGYAYATMDKANNTDLSTYEKDFLSLWEPIKIGHHSEWRHRKLIEKAHKVMDKRVELYDKSDEYANKAEYWKNKTFLMATEKKEKAEYIKQVTENALELWRDAHKVGGEYIWWHTGAIKIAKINKKTITTETGSTCDIKYAKDFDIYLKQAKYT